MAYGKLGAVMEYLKALPIEGDIKVDLLMGWARMVGAHINASQRDAVRQTGVDHQ
jgi:hypothetical protein